jgi:HPt (histidine-containing phosphotransfer) domain-containing protein
MSKELCKLDIELAIEEFELENVDKSLRLLIMDHYQYFRNEIQHAKKVKDTTKMKIAVHTLKSTSRYLCCEYFALKCQDIEDIIKNAWEQIDKVYDEYIQCYEWFYEDAKQIYETRFKEKEINEFKQDSNEIEEFKQENKIEESKNITVEIIENKEESPQLINKKSDNIIKLMGSNSSILTAPTIKLFKRNSTIKEENEDDTEQITNRKINESRRSSAFDKEGMYNFIRFITF